MRTDWQNPGIARWESLPKRDLLDALKDSGSGLSGTIPVGDNVGTGMQVSLSPKDHLATHMHIVGATGGGKSFFLEQVLRHLIRRGEIVFLITPHDEIYVRLLAYCAYLNRVRPDLRLSERVVPFDIDDTRRLVGFNPAARNAREVTYQVVALMEAIRRCWGADSFEATPRLARWLYNTGYAVVEPELTLVQAQRLVDSKPHPLRQAIVRRLENAEIKAEWEWVMSPRFQWPGKDDPLESSFNRIREFTSNTWIRLMLGQYRNTLDIASCMREGKILLANLDARNRMGEANRHLLGTLLVNEITAAAFARKPGHRRPVYLAIDEFQHFATKDICEILDGGRKYGLHLILAHQLLHQLKEKDPEVYYSTVTNARTKVVFGGLMDEDLDILGKELYVGELDPDEIKHEIWQTKFRPVESSRIVASEAESDSDSDSYSEVTHTSLSNAELFIADSGLLRQYPESVTFTNGSAKGTAKAHASSSSRSRSESEVPFYEFHEFKELSSVTFRSLDEQLYMKKAQLKRQPRQHAALLVPGERVQLMRAATVRDVSIRERDIDEFKHACWEAAGCFARPEDAEHQIAELEAKLLAAPTIDLDREQHDQDEQHGGAEDQHGADDDDSDYDRP